MAVDAEVVVVGMGAVGSAALLSLATRGIPCIGIDRFDPPHDRGSSHGLSRLIRLCYYEHPDYVPLLFESYRLWNELSETSGRRLLDITGGLYIGRSGDPFIAGSLRTAIERGLNYELLQPNQVRRRFPAIAIRDNESAFYEPTTGVLYPEECIRVSLKLAKERGACIVKNAKVVGFDHDSSGVTLRTHTSTYRANRMVLCAGAWMPQLLPQLATQLHVTRQVLAWFRPKRPELLSQSAIPAWAISRDDGAAHYGFPMMNQRESGIMGGEGFKLALHAVGPSTNPDTHDPNVENAEIEELREFLSERFSSAFDDKPELLRSRACMYTTTPDHHFLIDMLPDTDRVVVVSACSGHGFKMSPAIGLAAADLATAGETSLPIKFLSWRPTLPKV